ncbi:MAG: transglutaminase family protein [Planctomycetota bacterium]|nr:transglutaminase family protein [Planctomycetota bacterium]
MHYRITHRTNYRHSETVPLCQNALWLTPRNDGRQQRRDCRLEITPAPTNRSTRTDYFGNEVTYFMLDAGYRTLDVVAVSDVQVKPRSPAGVLPDTPAWETLAKSLCDDLSNPGIDACQFRFDSPSAVASDELADYARGSFTSVRPVAEAARELTTRLHTDFAYDPCATTVQTSVAEAFGLKRGVCQDFAHVQIACLRSLGLAARYVSGYLRTIPPPGQPRLVGADASHAWVSVFCGPAGWLAFDPTNDLVPSTDHVTIAWGRDYGDVTPVRGLFVGGGHHEMSVSVDVAPIDESGSEIELT